MVLGEKTLDDTKKVVLELLNRKIKYLNQMFEITKNTKFTNTEKDSEIYVLMIEKREKLLGELRVIDENLSLNKYADVFSDRDSQKEIKALVSDVQGICSKIVKLDIDINKYMEKIYFDIKDNLKNINHGKNLNTAYNTVDAFNDGYLFDKKN